MDLDERQCTMINYELTPFERGRLYAQGMAVDRLPTSLIGSETAGYLYGYKVWDSYFDVDAIVDIESRLYEEFGADGICVGPGLKGIAEVLGAELVYPENGICYVQRGLSLEMLDGLSVLDCRYLTKRMEANLESLKRLSEKYDGIVPVYNDVGGPFTTAAAVCGYEQFLRCLGKDTEKVQRCLDAAVESILAWVDLVYRACGAAPAIAEPLISGDLLSYSRFQAFAKPALERLVQGVEKITGSAPGLHVCGKSSRLWRDIAQIGIKSMSIDNCENLEDFKNQVGDLMGLGGNVSPTETLFLGTPEDVDARVKACVLAASDNPCGFSVGPGCQIPIGTPRRNLHAFMEASRKYTKNAVLGQRCKAVCEYQ